MSEEVKWPEFPTIPAEIFEELRRLRIFQEALCGATGTTGTTGTYRIAADGKSITCLICTRTSYNPNDVENRYCGYCHRFHEVPHA